MAYMQSNDPFLTDVLHSLRSGEERALEQIFGLYKDKLYAFCYKTLKSKDLADDVVIEVFTKIWDKRSEVRTDTSFDAFVFTIARNLLLNFLKNFIIPRSRNQTFTMYTLVWRNKFCVKCPPNGRRYLDCDWKRA
jgi:hypothetical protein